MNSGMFALCKSMEEYSGGKGAGGLSGLLFQGSLSNQDHSYHSHFRPKELVEPKLQFSLECGMNTGRTGSAVEGLEFSTGAAPVSTQHPYDTELVRHTPNHKPPSLKPQMVDGEGGVEAGMFPVSGHPEFPAGVPEQRRLPLPASIKLERKAGSLESCRGAGTYLGEERLAASPGGLESSKESPCANVTSQTSVITQTGYGCKVCATCRLVYEEVGFVSLNDSCSLCIRHVANGMKCNCIRDEKCLCKAKTYSCAYCGDKFSTTFMLQKHTFTHCEEEPKRLEESEVQEFRCPVCKVTAEDQNALEAHLRSHSQTFCSECNRSFVMFDSVRHSCKARFCCPLCGTGCPSNYNLKMHMLKHSGSLPYKCPHCDKAFAKPSELSRHTMVHTGERPHVCAECGMCFTNMTNLKNHKATHTGVRPYPCSVCNKSFTRPGDVKRHMLIHTGARPFACEVCGLTFADPSNLKKHVTMHKAGSNAAAPSNEIKTYQCTYCSKLFSRPSELKRHFFTHTNTRPYSCNFCGLAFSDSSNLRKHVTTHVKASEHCCYQCDEKFDSFGELESHMMSHSAPSNPEGTNVCNVCGAMFAHLAEFQEHCVSHGNSQTFKCEVCSKNFSQEIFLQKHILTHTESRPYTCPECLRSFKALSHLKSHTLTHRGEKTHVCPVCNKSFLKKSSLRRHLNLHSRDSKMLPLCEVFVD